MSFPSPSHDRVTRSLIDREQHLHRQKVHAIQDEISRACYLGATDFEIQDLLFQLQLATGGKAS